MDKKVDVKDWVKMFEEIGLNEQAMHRWHGIFETRHPASHQSFLEWLGLPPDKINQIRSESKKWAA